LSKTGRNSGSAREARPFKIDLKIILRQALLTLPAYHDDIGIAPNSAGAVRPGERVADLAQLGCPAPDDVAVHMAR
jgi:hypothetical protein